MTAGRHDLSTTDLLVEFLLLRLGHAYDEAHYAAISTRSGPLSDHRAAQQRADDLYARRSLILEARRNLNHGSNVAVTRVWRQVLHQLAYPYRHEPDFRADWLWNPQQGGNPRDYS